MTAVPPKAQRLYDSVDEFMFDPSRNAQILSQGQAKQSYVDQAKFFLTAHSRAPEINLLGTPRVLSGRSMSTWPRIRTASTRPPPIDSWPFARRFMARANRRCGDSSAALLFPATAFLDPTNDYVNISRNKDLYAYLDYLTRQNIPGFGGNFFGKFVMMTIRS